MRVTSRAARPPGLAALVTLATVLSLVSIVAHLALLVVVVRATPTPEARSTPTRGPGSPSRPTANPTAPAAGGGGIPGPSRTDLPLPVSTAQLTEPPVPAFDDACLRKDNPPTGATLPAKDPFGDSIDHLGDGAELQRLYAVRDGSLVALDGLGSPRACDLQLWALVTATAPTQVAYLEEFLVFDAEPDPAPDQFVIEGEATPKRMTWSTVDDRHWRLSFAPNGLDRGDLAWLVAHELAHIISLNDTQTTPVEEPVCADLDVGSGCLRPVALLSRYLHATWDDALYDAWVAADKAADGDPESTAYQDFHAKHEDAFATRYAATDPVEDFAESFALWCTFEDASRARSRLPRTNATDVGHKVDWFSGQTSDLVPELEPGCAMLRKFAGS